MNLRTTTPASNSLTRRVVLMLIAIFMFVAVPMQFSQMANASPTVAQLEAKIAQLDQDIAEYQKEAARLSGEARTLQVEVSRLASEKAIIQTQIDINQAKYDKLLIQIKETEKKIVDNQDALGETIADLYIDDQVSPLEMVASSKNISEYLDKQEYRNSVRDTLLTTISEIKQLKKELGEHKAEVEKILGEQKNARQTLSVKEAEQQALLDQTKGSQAAYESLSAAGKTKRQQLVNEQIALMAQSTAGSIGISDPTKGNYPWAGNGCYVDANLYSHSNNGGYDPLGYACRQCTSYVGWKMLERTGIEYKYWGHAQSWGNSARNAGLSVGRTAKANSVGVMSSGPYGHVVWVESDPDSQGRIIVSQYNYYNEGGSGWGHYSKMLVPASTYGEFIYF